MTLSTRERVELSDTTELAVRLSVAITRLRSRLREQGRAETAGLSFSHLSMLRRIRDDGPITVTALAAAEHVRQQTGTQTVAALRTAGLVETSSDPSDGRRVLVSVTADGDSVLDRIIASREAWLAAAIAELVPASERGSVAAAIELVERLANVELG